MDPPQEHHEPPVADPKACPELARLRQRAEVLDRERWWDQNDLVLGYPRLQVLVHAELGLADAPGGVPQDPPPHQEIEERFQASLPDELRERPV